MLFATESYSPVSAPISLSGVAGAADLTADRDLAHYLAGMRKVTSFIDLINTYADPRDGLLGPRPGGN